MISTIQVLRAYAALAVVFFHIHPFGYTVGSYGVDIFFIISGFIMSYVCEKQPDRFIEKRIVRVVPLYWLCTLMLFIIAWLMPSLLNSTTADITNLFKSFFFIPYRKESGAIQPILTVGWTLNYEILFYAAVALALRLVPHRFATVYAAIALGCLVLIFKVSGSHSVPSLFYSNYMIFEFGFGVATYWIWRKYCTSLYARGRTQWIIVLATMTIVMAWAEATHLDQTDYGRLLYFGLPAFFTVLAALFLESSKAITTKFLLALGNASYSIYLVHSFIVEAVRKIVATKIPFLNPDSILGIIFIYAVVIASGLTVHYLIEKPITGFLTRRKSSVPQVIPNVATL